MSSGRDRPPSPDPVDDVYELDLEDESPEEVLREAVEAAEAPRPAVGEERDSGVEGAGPEPVAAMREKYLRVLADFDNYRKRVERERGETARGALMEPLREFLGVVDNLDRALASGGSFEDLKAGVEMILRQTGDLLRRFDVEEVPALGQPFDPAVHEAVVRYEDPRVHEPMVSEEFQKGYLYRGRLLRPAMVRVAVPQEAAEAAGDADGGSGS